MPSVQSDEGALDILATLSNVIPRRPNSNPLGNNQFSECPSKNDPEFIKLLEELHKISTSVRLVSRILEKKYGIIASPRTISRRWQDMGLATSGKTESRVPRGKITQLVDQMAPDPTGQTGKNTMKHCIALGTGYHPKRGSTGKIQSEGSSVALPSGRRIRRTSLTSAGPNEVWCCDGHDKLCKYGFAIWGLRDKFSRKWLGLWVLPNDHIAHVIAYLWLTVVRDIGGMPMQTSTDCEGESSLAYGLVNALRETLASADTNPSEKPVHLFLQSVRHIPIERSWLDLRKSFGDDFIHFWGEGSCSFDEQNPTHQLLIRWLWPPVIQHELDKFRMQENSRKVRKQHSAVLPSGTLPNTAYDLPEGFGGRDCLQHIDRDFVQGMLNDMQPQKDALSDWDVPEEFAERADAARQACSFRKITISNVWLAFHAILFRL